MSKTQYEQARDYLTKRRVANAEFLEGLNEDLAAFEALTPKTDEEKADLEAIITQTRGWIIEVEGLVSEADILLAVQA